MVTVDKSIAVRRFLAFGVDWLLIAAWAGVLFGIVMFAYSGKPPRPSGPWESQFVGLIAMTIPVLLYFFLSESSACQATLGKRVLGLRVITTQNARPRLAKTLFRNLIKFIPWELGHIVANQAVFSAVSIHSWTYIPMVLAFALPIWWVTSIVLRGRSPYDMVSDTRVIRSLPA